MRMGTVIRTTEHYQPGAVGGPAVGYVLNSNRLANEDLRRSLATLADV
jgi:hypothetical protein